QVLLMRSRLMQLGIVCPVDRHELTRRGEELCCDAGHSYRVVDGIPVLLRGDVPMTHGAAARSLDAARTGTVVKYWSDDTSEGNIEPLVQRIVGATNGNLYRYAIG